MQPKARKLTLLLCSMFWMGVATVSQAKYPVAGVKPDSRPVGAPMIQMVRHDKEWFEQAMTGVDKPYPKSLGFIHNQGNWHTPFTIPGMRGPYDLRGWHK